MKTSRKVLFLSVLILSASAAMPAFAADGIGSRFNRGGEGRMAGEGRAGRGEAAQRIKNMTPEERAQWKAEHPEAAKRMEEARAKWQAKSPEEKKQFIQEHRGKREGRFGGRGNN